MGLPFWSRGATARQGCANLSREKEEEQEWVKKKKKRKRKTENEKEGREGKRKEKKPNLHLSYLLCTPGPRSQHAHWDNAESCLQPP